MLYVAVTHDTARIGARSRDTGFWMGNGKDNGEFPRSTVSTVTRFISAECGGYIDALQDDSLFIGLGAGGIGVVRS